VKNEDCEADERRRIMKNENKNKNKNKKMKTKKLLCIKLCSRSGSTYADERRNSEGAHLRRLNNGTV